MELLIETSTATEGLSQYEIERNKPTPTLIYGAIQFNLGFGLKSQYPTRFRIASEVALDTQPTASTPDLVLYPAGALDFKNNPARRLDAPLLIIEIQSPSQSSKDMVDKLEPYFHFGVKSCWIVVPEFKGIFVYDSPFSYAFFRDTETVKDVVMDIEIDLQKVFA